MGASQSDINDADFARESMRENFVLSIVQCKVEGPMPFKKEVINKRKSTQNFVILTKGERSPAKIWHSSSILVAALVLEEPPLNQFECSFYQYHDQMFLAIYVDAATYYHLCFFMNKSRFFAKREEFLTRVLSCIEDYDDILARYIMKQTEIPTVRMPSFELANPYENEESLGNDSEFEFDSTSGQLFNLYETTKKPEFLSQRSSQSSSFLGPVSEPDSLSESMTVPLSEDSSSSFGPISEPSTNQINYAESNSSSAFNPVSEPESSSSVSGLSYTGASSTFGPISESGSSRSSRRHRTHHRQESEVISSDSGSISDKRVRNPEVPQARRKASAADNDSDQIGTLDKSLHSESSYSSNSRKSRNNAGRIKDVDSVHSMHSKKSGRSSKVGNSDLDSESSSRRRRRGQPSADSLHSMND